MCWRGRALFMALLGDEGGRRWDRPALALIRDDALASGWELADWAPPAHYIRNWDSGPGLVPGRRPAKRPMDRFGTRPFRIFALFQSSKSRLISCPRIRNLITEMRLEYETALGHLYRADCLEFLGTLADGSVATFFADPPFNLKKDYGSNGSDNLPDQDYLKWCERWLSQGVRALAPGGAFFVYNLPKWLMPIGTFLGSLEGMTFKHWIAVDKAHSLPIPNRLSTSHYGMLYFIKGDKPRVFNRDAVRIPIQLCRHCGRDVKDYGGHKKFLNPKGLRNL